MTPSASATWSTLLRFTVLGVVGLLAAVALDSACAARLGVSLVAGNPLRAPHPIVCLAGWVLLGLALPLGWLFERRSATCVLIVLSPTLGFALTELHGRSEGIQVGGLGLLTLIVVGASRPLRIAAPWACAVLLAIVFVVIDPAHSIARSRASGAAWWIAVAACGAAQTRPLWRDGWTACALGNGLFWTCAFWSLLANARDVSRYSIGLSGTIWRSGCAWGGDGLEPIAFVWPAALEIALLLILLEALHRLGRARPR